MDEFIEYGMYDVYCLFELYQKMNDVINDMEKIFTKKLGQIGDEVEKVSITDIMTIGGYVYGKMKQY